MAIRFYASMMALALAVSACKSGAEAGQHQNHEAAAQTMHDHAPGDHAEETLYGCPMHKEMVGSKGDRCPLCNYMELVPVTWSLDGVDTVRVTSLPDYNPPRN